MDKAAEAVALEKQRIAERRATDPGRLDHMDKAKVLVAEVFNSQADHREPLVAPSEIYVVTFAYILGGWKAMLSSDAWDDTSYFEVTYNVAKHEAYVDHYRKVSNTPFSDGDIDLLSKEG